MFEGLTEEAASEIRQRLDSVRAEGCRIGFAVESGSRAWGFPSPDSDFDCRFVYVRPVRQHLEFRPRRDVIEFPIVGDIDTGGWDLRKALLLALKGNAVIVEWLKSPLVYEEEPDFRDRLSRLLDEIMQPQRVARHYAGLLREHAPERDLKEVKLKRFLYAVRPAVALQWMSDRDFSALPPMNMLECLEGASVPQDVRDEILRLIALKRTSREMGEASLPSCLRHFVAQTDADYAGLGSRFKADGDDGAARFAAAELFYLLEVERT